jgi:hypothetical protein
MLKRAKIMILRVALKYADCFMFSFGSIKENLLNAKLPNVWLMFGNVSVVIHCLQFVISEWFTMCKPVILCLCKLVKCCNSYRLEQSEP